MKKMKLLLLGFSLILGMTGTCAFAGYMPSASPVRQERLAWWGALYPEYCLPGAMELKGEEENCGSSGEIPVKIRFKYLTVFNQAEE